MASGIECQTSAPCRVRQTVTAATPSKAPSTSRTNLTVHPSGGGVGETDFRGPRRTRTSDLFVISEAL